MKQNYFDAMNTRNIKILFTLVSTFVIIGNSHATVIFEASDTNTSTVQNTVAGSTSRVGDTATGTLVVTNTFAGTNNFNGGFGSTDDINTLLAAQGLPAISDASLVEITLVVDSIAGNLNANGVTFGLGDTATSFPNADGTLGGLAINLTANGNQDIEILNNGGGVNANGGVGGVTEASILDGFEVLLTADTNGFTFSFSDLISSGVAGGTAGGTPADITGTFAAGEFVSLFSTGFFNTSTQSTGAAGAVTTISTAEIHVSTIPEPSSFALIFGIGSFGLLLRRRRALV